MSGAADKLAEALRALIARWDSPPTALQPLCAALAAYEAERAPERTLLDQSPDYRKGYEEGRFRGYEVGLRHGREQAERAAPALMANGLTEADTSATASVSGFKNEPRAQAEPSPHSLTVELREALGLFAGAMPSSPQKVWQESIEYAKQLRDRTTLSPAEPVAWQDVVIAIQAVGAEAARRGEMFPQTREEQNEDRAAVRRVAELVTWYAKHGGAIAMKLPNWPKRATPQPEPSPQVPLTYAQIRELVRDAQIAFCLNSDGSFENTFSRVVEAACAKAWGVKLTAIAQSASQPTGSAG